jgi:hypothetical protein
MVTAGSLEVVDYNGTSTVWSETFATDCDAHTAFLKHWRPREFARFQMKIPVGYTERAWRRYLIKTLWQLIRVGMRPLRRKS